jgi:hypothetical protein
MPIYRLYVIDPDAHITVPPTLADCPDDDLAIAKAKQYLDGKAIEVWEGARIVTRLEPIRC